MAKRRKHPKQFTRAHARIIKKLADELLRSAKREEILAKRIKRAAS